MRLLEYEAKNILKNYDILIPDGKLIFSADNYFDYDFDFPVMLKTQLPIGGRGKAGGVLRAADAKEAKMKAEILFSKSIKGYKANRILVEKEHDIVSEYYMAIVYNTVVKLPMVIFSLEGGVDIEEFALLNPEEVIKECFCAGSSLFQYQARNIISSSGISGSLLLRLGSILSKLAGLFLDFDATIVEVNPLILTKNNQLLALDCHIDIEDDALFRHPDIATMQKDKNRINGGKASTEFERKAAEIDSIDHRGVAGRVIEFEGTMGLIIGGGGASLTAFDAIKAHGGKPANYCEIGGNPSVFKVKELTKHILSKPGVEKIAVIMNVLSNTRVDLVARGVIKGVIESEKTPSETIAIFRVPGAWEKEGFKILSHYNVHHCDRTVSIDKAAQMAVEKMSE